MTTLNDITTNLQFFHQNVLDFYQADISPQEKWTKIATYMHENSFVASKTFDVIRKENKADQIELDYKTKFETLQEQIAQESDPLRKCSFIVLSLHQMLYHLLSIEGNYYFYLIGKEEMAILKKDIIYYINLSIKNEQNVYFHAYILLYALESVFNRHFYVGVDFEYTHKKIQLAQLNFEHNVSLKSIIMMVSPAELEEVMMNDFINLIMCNRYIKKILHGSDSLDIPYVYNHMLNDDPKRIIKFTKALIDTRFLCEYYKLNQHNSIDNKCSIYDEDPARSAIYYFGVISKEQQDKLSELLQSMPAPYDIVWNIHKMPKSQVLYAQYDVIFLKYFYYRIIHVATEAEDTDLGKKSIIELYKHVIAQLIQFVYLENNKITFLRNKCKEEVDVANNYFTKGPGGIKKMIDIFNQVSVDIITTNPNVDISKIIKVSHFKKSILILIKRLIYGHISYKCRIFKDKSTIWTDKLPNKFIFDFFQKMGFTYLLDMFKGINNVLEARINMICPEA